MMFTELLVPVLALVIIPLKTYSVQGQVIHTLGEGIATWESASSTCTLATPKIDFTDGEMLTVFGGGAINMTEGEEAWLGYVLESVILQNVGCMKFDVDKEPRLSTHYDTGADPGKCFSACRHTGYFGLMKTKCFCFNTSLPMEGMFETTCRQPCSKLDEEAACGGNNVISLYRRATELVASDVADPPITRNIGNCILYDRNVNMFFATKCTMSYRIGCQRMSGEVVDILSRTVSWLEMTSYCSGEQLYPYTYDAVLKDTGDYFQMWTGMIKARKVSRQNQGQPLYIAYVRVQNGNYKIGFASPASTVEKKFICQEGVQTTTETFDVTKSATEPTGTPDVYKEASTDVKKANLLPLYIIIPILLVLLAVALILIIIRWRRKTRKEELKSRNSMKSPYGKVGKSRKRSLAKGSHLSDDTAKALNMAEVEAPATDRKSTTRNSNHSNNLIATISLDNATFNNEAFLGDSNEDPTTKNGREKEKHTEKVKSNKKNKDDSEFKSGRHAKDDQKFENEYARINKKKTGPQKEEEQMYDKAGSGNKDNNRLETNYGKAVFGNNSDMYDTTSKPMSVRPRDYLYDGLHKF